jgi:hypothetical protein
MRGAGFLVSTENKVIAVSLKAAVRAGVQRHVETNGGVHENPVRVLSSALRSSPNTVTEAIDSLERAGKLDVGRAGEKIMSVRRPERTVHDRTAFSPAAKRERTFAKGVPAVLLDSMCTPVVTIQTRQREEPVQETPRQSLEDVSVLKQLNLVFVCLRILADEHGELPSGGVAKMLIEHFDISLSHAAYLNGQLGKLGLRTTRNLGAEFDAQGKRSSGARFVSTVDTNCQEISQAMLDALRMTSESASQSEPKSEETPVSEAADDVSVQLVAIIHQLEEKLTEVNANRGRLESKVETLERENTELRAQLALRAEPPTIVQDVLARYQK